MRYLTVHSDTVLLDSLSIIPGTVSIATSSGIQLDTSLYKINYGDAKLIFNRQKMKPAVDADSLKISYKTFPYLFSAETKHKDLNRISADIQGRNDPFSYTLEAKNEDLFKMEGLNKSGSISRGISFG
ncbi:MAG TPA: hypothetical protein VFM99_09925, partial [Chitinophagales bacterium]|nr:hypothetical protein [Chitinophagales bacterium]